ncbi:MAG TPA: YjfI family protein [Xanthomonadaceae bacterium]
MERRSSAFYQRRHRDRLREQGLVKKELWVLPEYADELAAVERRMRQPRGAAPAAVRAEGELAMRDKTLWTAKALHDALIASDGVRLGALSAELIEGAEPGLYLTMHDYGDLPLYMAVVGRQIVVEAMLWPVSQVHDAAGFNEELLRTHKLFPLSTLGIETIDGEAVYIMFGALSSASSLADVLFEMETLADNVIRATEAYAWHLREAA